MPVTRETPLETNKPTLDPAWAGFLAEVQRLAILAQERRDAKAQDAPTALERRESKQATTPKTKSKKLRQPNLKKEQNEMAA